MQRNHSTKLINVLSFLFFMSGVSALIYQIAWQRILFSNLGSDIESVTIIVSVFMFGLGVGAIIGGRVVDAFPYSAILIFSAIEIGIGIFGIFSKEIILGVSSYFYSDSLLITTILSFCVILFPTMLMGATLPILITFLARKWANVGAATGHLYSFNTLGAAIGAFIVGFLLFEFFTLTQSIYIAATINILVAFFTLFFLRGKDA
jgi:predicted membrane-bound spermidine synthase